MSNTKKSSKKLPTSDMESEDPPYKPTRRVVAAAPESRLERVETQSQGQGFDILFSTFTELLAKQNELMLEK